jgi:pimeloyl-ACP methyl ester carboxylesterase
MSIGVGAAIVLFLTGLGASAHQFDSFAPRFTANFHVLGLTRRQGLSDKPLAGYDTATLAEDINGFLDVMRLQPVNLIAHSIGGREMTRFAAESSFGCSWKSALLTTVHTFMLRIRMPRPCSLSIQGFDRRHDVRQQHVRGQRCAAGVSHRVQRGRHAAPDLQQHPDRQTGTARRSQQQFELHAVAGAQNERCVQPSDRAVHRDVRGSNGR